MVGLSNVSLLKETAIIANMNWKNAVVTIKYLQEYVCLAYGKYKKYVYEKVGRRLGGGQCLTRIIMKTKK